MSGPENSAPEKSGATPQLRVSAWAIRNPIPIAVLFIALLIGGFAAYNALPIKNSPNIDFPGVVITVTRNGAAPAEMENQVTRLVENSLAGLSNVQSINSTVVQGASTTVILFDLGQNAQKETDDVRSKIDEIRNSLPHDVDPPIVQQLEVNSSPISTYAISAPSMSMSELSWFIDNTVARDLQAEPGVGKINRLGGVDREINILVDPDRLAAQGVSASQLNDALAAANLDAPGGRVSIGGREQTLRVLGAALTVDQIRNLSIPGANGRSVRLSDVADVGDGEAETRNLALLDGRPVVGFQVSMVQGGSEVSVDKNVTEGIAKLLKDHPEVSIRKIDSQVDYTRKSYEATLHTLIEGMGLAAIVVWLFLRDWRATLITAIAMPASLIPTFMFMSLMGFSLNFVTLLGLTLVIGILVDDAIVEIENIEKRVHTGARPYWAAIIGADQIGLAVLATTGAIAAVFLPTAFMPGIVGEYFYEFGLTVSVAVLFSLVVARLLTPLLAAYFLKPKAAQPRKPLPALYTKSLGWALDHRWVTVALAILLFIGSLALAIPLKKAVSPEGDPDEYTVNIQTPPGSTLADMKAVIDRVDQVLTRQSETAAVFASAGGDSGVTNGSVIAVRKPVHKMKVGQIRDQIRAELQQIPDARISFDTSGFGGASVDVTLTSETGENLDAAALELQREMGGVKGLADARPSNQPSGPELIVRPRPDEASRLGVSAAAIANAARIATLGDIDANVAKLDQGERRIPIRIRLPEADRANLSVIQNLRLPTASGGITTLGAVADVYFQAGPVQIDRISRKRNITITADTVNGVSSGDALNAVNALPILKHLPPGVERETGQGNDRIISDMVTGFISAILEGTGLVFAVMVLLFRSFFKPLVIQLSLITAIGGSFFALLVTGLPLSMPSLIGFMMLMGLAAKNSILLVEYAAEREREGKSQREALMEASRERARPIVMTTVAMMAGMAPAALGLGTASEFRQVMAVSVIGGLITSTTLSLVLVPVVYELFDDLETWLKPRIGRLVTPREAAPVPAEAAGTR